MSFSAGGFLSASDGYCSTEQLQYYGESSDASVSASLFFFFFATACTSAFTFASPSPSVFICVSLKQAVQLWTY